MSKDLKSICVVIRHDQHERLQDMDINVSGFIRDIIDDRLSDHTITLNVSPETRELYHRIVSTSSKGDAEIEPLLREALKKMLDQRIREMTDLKKSLL